jgi:hypothetical protein
MAKPKVKILKVIQLRHEYNYGGHVYSDNKTYQKPGTAARVWAEAAARAWGEKTFGRDLYYSPSHRDILREREQRYFRKSIVVFRKMLDQ